MSVKRNLTYEFMRKKPIHIVDNLYLYQHTIEEIEEEVGYENYNKVIMSATREPYELEYHLEDIGIDYKDVTYFNLFILLTFSDHKVDFFGEEVTEADVTIKVLNFMFNADFEIREFANMETKFEIDKKVFFDNNSQSFLCKDNFHTLKNILAKMFLIKKPKRRVAANDYAKELIKRDMAKRSEEGIDSDIYSIIMSLLWSPNCKETNETIWKLTPYQIYNGYLTVEKIKNYDNVMEGYYSGNIDPKNIDFNKIHWSSKLK